MTNADVLNLAGREIETILTEAFGSKPKFALVIQVDGDPTTRYLANGNRMDVIKVLRETATALEIKQN